MAMLSRRSSATRGRRSMAVPKVLQDPGSEAPARTAAGRVDDVVLPMFPGSALLHRGAGPRTLNSMPHPAPSIMNGSPLGTLDLPPGDDGLVTAPHFRPSGVQPGFRGMALPSGYAGWGPGDSIRLPPAFPSFGSLGPAPASAGAYFGAVAEPAGPGGGPALGALWGTGHSSLSGRQLRLQHREGDTEDSAPLGSGPPAGSTAAETLGDSGDMVRSEEPSTPLHSCSRLYASPGSAKASSPSSSPRSPRQVLSPTPRSGRRAAAGRAAAGSAQGFQGPFCTLQPLAVAETLRFDLAQADSAPPVMRSAAAEVRNAVATSGALAGTSASGAAGLGRGDCSDMHSLGSGSNFGGSDSGDGGTGRSGAALAIPSYAVDFSTGTLRLGESGQRKHDEGQAGQRGTRSRQGDGGSALGEGLRRRSVSSGFTSGRSRTNSRDGQRCYAPGSSEASSNMVTATLPAPDQRGRWWRRVARVLAKQHVPQSD